MSQRTRLYEGKAKILYTTDDPALCVQYFKDDATAFDGLKKGIIEGKGIANATISSRLFRLLEEQGLKTHFVAQLSPNEMLVRRVTIIPVEVVVRNLATGSLCKRYTIREGLAFRDPLVEYYYKDDALHDPLIYPDHLIAFGWVTDAELQTLREMALRVNRILSAFLEGLEITLVDIKLEFGRLADQILLADEISPDTCRLWEKGTQRKLDKDRFRQDLGNVAETYREMLQRISGADQ